MALKNAELEAAKLRYETDGSLEAAAEYIAVLERIVAILEPYAMLHAIRAGDTIFIPNTNFNEIEAARVEGESHA